MRERAALTVAVIAAVAAAALAAAGTRTLAPPPAGAVLQPGSRVWLDAHNCYPEQGAWADRIERALGTGLPWMSIEQDIAWAPDPASPGGGLSVVSHETTLRGDEPTLESHFFARVRPMLERALAEGARAGWPVLVLHLDFKTNEPEHHRFIWDLLGRHERFLTTAVKTGEGRAVPPLRPGPLIHAQRPRA